MSRLIWIYTVCDKSEVKRKTDRRLTFVLYPRNHKDDDDSEASVCYITKIFDISLAWLAKLQNIVC